MKRYSEEEKKMWLEDWQASGKSAWAYTKANGLNLQTLFVEVTPAERISIRRKKAPKIAVVL